MIIKAQPLNREAFAPYGQVLAGTASGPERHAFAANMENLRAQAKANMTFMRVSLAAAPLRIESLERHRFSNQTFVPLNGTRHLIAVCPSMADGEPDILNMTVFSAEGSQAVNYNPDVWHAPRTAIAPPGEFIMFRWDDGSEVDTEKRPLADPVEIEL